MSTVNAPVSAGDVLAGKYRIDRVLGAGGMGVVVAATHVDLEQKVAIKFLLPQALENKEVVERFKREARTAIKIQSEHVARVIDVGSLDVPPFLGAPYMVMEYLEGSDLAQRIASGPPLTVAEAARFLLEACEALAEAHAAGIVHRDIKPANLFLAKRADKTSSVKVLDFGISKANVGGAAAAGGITSTQAVMGSPYYMSPEQLMSAKHVDARSDVWSLGIVLYESLVGSPPYVGDTLAEIVAKILQGETPRVTPHRTDVPREVDAILARCLAKDVAGRYRDVGELAAALAPLTTDGARSVDRIARILGSSIHPPRPSVSDASPSDTGRGGTVAMSRTPITNPSPVAVSGAHANTSPGWGTTDAGLPKKRTGVWLAVAGVIGLAGIGAAAFAIKKPPVHDTPASNGLAVSVDVPHVSPPPPIETTAAPIASPAAPPPVSVATTSAPTSRPVATTKPSATAKPPASVASTHATPPPATTTTSTSALHMGIK